MKALRAPLIDINISSLKPLCITLNPVLDDETGKILNFLF
jgi:hypothetical protein